jgi:hypothetical protein
LTANDNGALYTALDRNYTYEWSNPLWRYRAGVAVDVVADLYSGLSTQDAGSLFYASDTYTWYVWSGLGWITAGGAVWEATADSTTAAQWKTSGGTVVIDLDTTHKRVGINTTPLVDLDVAGEIRASTGYRQAGSEVNAGWVLRANGTDFVGASLAAADLSNGVTGSGAVVLSSLLGAGPFTVALAKLTSGGANGSLSVNAQGMVTAYTPAT